MKKWFVELKVKVKPSELFEFEQERGEREAREDREESERRVRGEESERREERERTDRVKLLGVDVLTHHLWRKLPRHFQRRVMIVCF